MPQSNVLQIENSGESTTAIRTYYSTHNSIQRLVQWYDPSELLLVSSELLFVNVILHPCLHLCGL